MFQELSWEDNKEQELLTGRLFSGSQTTDLKRQASRSNSETASKNKVSECHSRRKDQKRKSDTLDRVPSKDAHTTHLVRSATTHRTVGADIKWSESVPVHTKLVAEKTRKPKTKTKRSRIENDNSIREDSHHVSTSKKRKMFDLKQDKPSGCIEEPVKIKLKTEIESHNSFENANEPDKEEDSNEESDLCRAGVASSIRPLKFVAKFQKKLQKKLDGGQFRWLNEQLYTSHSLSANNLFKENPKLFHVYHAGYTNQVKSWPQNPVDSIIDYIKSRSSSLVVADFGCGDAKIAQTTHNLVHSFDLVSKNPFVTACDMAKVPLQDTSIDIAVFCLSLMGTNTQDFLAEAHRVLKLKGTLKIAEVASRFEDLDAFLKNVSSCGFKLISKDTSNKYFVLVEFRKSTTVFKKPKAPLVLKPCIYKRR